MRTRGLTVLRLFTSTAVLAENLARGQEIVQQKCDACHTLRDEQVAKPKTSSAWPAIS